MRRPISLIEKLLIPAGFPTFTALGKFFDVTPGYARLLVLGKRRPGPCIQRVLRGRSLEDFLHERAETRAREVLHTVQQPEGITLQTDLTVFNAITEVAVG